MNKAAEFVVNLGVTEPISVSRTITCVINPLMFLLFNYILIIASYALSDQLVRNCYTAI